MCYARMFCNLRHDCDSRLWLLRLVGHCHPSHPFLVQQEAVMTSPNVCPPIQTLRTYPLLIPSPTYSSRRVWSAWTHRDRAPRCIGCSISEDRISLIGLSHWPYHSTPGRRISRGKKIWPITTPCSARPSLTPNPPSAFGIWLKQRHSHNLAFVFLVSTWSTLAAGERD